VVILGETRFQDKIKKMSIKSDELYDEKFVSIKGPFSRASKCIEAATNNIGDKGSSMSFVDEDVVPNKADIYAGGDKMTQKFWVPCNCTRKEVERRYYTAICKLASSSQYSKSVIVDIGGCNLKFFSLGDSMTPHKKVCTFVVNYICQKFFLDERPTVSLKHYFFSCVSVVFMSDSDDYSYVERCFNGAASILPLPLCEMLFFPVLYGEHWFLFVVDLKRKLFLFLDSYFSKDAEYSIYTRRKLISRFQCAWDMFVGSNAEFHRFKIAYPHVPKQENTYVLYFLFIYCLHQLMLL